MTKRPEKMKAIGRLFPLWVVLLALLLAGGVWQASRWAGDVELEAMTATGQERLTLYASTLRGALNRYAYLPYVLARNASVQNMLAQGKPSVDVSRYLEELNREAGSEALYVMDAAGDTLASSNWRETTSFVGRNYAFRPYFTAAREGRQGRFFAIGVTTGRPGFFMSHPVRRDGRFAGVAVVKVDLDPLQDDWREGGETVLVSDANGVIFLSSRSDWKYTTLAPLSAEQRRRIRAGRQYGDKPLRLSPLRTVEVMGEDRRIVRAAGERYLLLSRSLPGLGWKLFYLASLAPVRERSRAVTAIGTVLVLLLFSCAMYMRERRQKQLSRRKAREAEAIKAINLRLQEEIEEHRRTEQALRDAQAELVQSSKLAALGQMSAGIVHELNQPIAAMRTYAASGRLLLDRHEEEKVRETFAAISRITDHMASVTAQLKIFAHKAPQQRERVVIQSCLDEALTLTAPLFDEHGVELVKEVPDDAVAVSGGSGRLRQVLVNLIRNGIDAMRDSERRELRIRVAARAETVEIEVRDSGTGIAEQDLDELFNPFFTTKEVGKGLGLGLSISYRIVTDLGGTIRATNNPDRGARFIVRLPLLADRTAGEEQ
ncbi:two-component system C4-dicarboxylate transport sensor histidine kinase DctB [Geothermobacter ehrlichii]|uniref:C4-dicarboxylate transport sensor protein DctB n=1 Tax=Geothermobacter ehrlichii TaxID=213224 RepID=A0A5D3WGS3_9BACT|nr:ATP-binding protein [Geothermobacter ehrlichii]TYO95784.1 two-component system C4-dicarboxylate transport sensor histidine kinase DctB [Geothermobacter ehrlichii]